MTRERQPLALTMGEPGGVGAEITAAAWKALRSGDLAFFTITDPDLIRAVEAPVEIISDPSAAVSVFSNAVPVLPVKNVVSADPGVASPDNAPAVTESIERAVAFAVAGEAAGVVTNPIQKSSLNAAGFSFPGHTEFLEALTTDAPMPGGRTRGAVMMLAGPQLKTVPATVHVSVADAVRELRADLIIRKSLITAEALRDDFGIETPRIAISALNPHAGEQGAMGVEDAMIIAPAVTALREMGLDARGPLPADTMFHAEAREKYDAAICMLHDQALIPAKTLAFHEAVNVTLGLPIIRTSPDHGAALDIAGRNVARADSLIAALRLAASMAERRGRRA